MELEKKSSSILRVNVRDEGREQATEAPLVSSRRLDHAVGQQRLSSGGTPTLTADSFKEPIGLFE